MNQPPVFLRDENDVPLATFGVFTVPRGQLRFCSSAAAPESSGFVQGGAPVQPALHVTGFGFRAGLMFGLGGGLTVGAMVPWSEMRAEYGIGGLPATGTANGVGGLLLFAKKPVWWGGHGDFVVASAGLELPTGQDACTFAQSNAVTNAYYSGYPQRMPLAWQPSNGAFNGHFVLGYLKRAGRVSYEGTAALKLHGAGDEDVMLGNILILAANGTCGLSERTALSLGLVYRSQGDDSYPNMPVASNPALAGTTTHGSAIYLDPTLRFDLTRRITIGLGMRQVLMQPDDGMIPRSRFFLIAYPKL